MTQKRFSVSAAEEEDVSVHDSREQEPSTMPQDVPVTIPVVINTKLRNHKPALVPHPAEDEVSEVMEAEEVTAAKVECTASVVEALTPAMGFKTPAVEASVTPQVEDKVPVMEAFVSVGEKTNDDHPDYDSDGASSLASCASGEVWNDLAIAQLEGDDDDISPMEILKVPSGHFSKEKG